MTPDARHVALMLLMGLLAPLAHGRSLRRSKCGRLDATFYPDAQAACASCQENKAPTCTCMVGDCTPEMDKRSGGECGSDQGVQYFCAVCGPLKFPVAGGKEVKTTDHPKENDWINVHPC